MKYAAMIYGDQAKRDSFPVGERPEAIARQEASHRKHRESGEPIGAHGMAGAAPARPVRRVDGVPAVTDGPYPETEEHLAGFCPLDRDSPERAREIAADMPFADVDPVEPRPVPHESAADV
ncbi:YciI family protein [Streptomyces sp. NPDC092359]|uniref:YciI family protein n=1 Tax=Streptomyces sp. NPDC092359 TaxID=3366014 RepID=UPI0038200323